jgi:hypothetical protein
MVGMVFVVVCCAESQYCHFTPTECAHRSRVHIFGDKMAAFGEHASDSFIGTLIVVNLKLIEQPNMHLWMSL